MSEESKTLIDGIRKTLLDDYERRLLDLYFLEKRLADMQRHCIFRINGVCWLFCDARDYCRPEDSGLVSVKELGQREKGEGKKIPNP